MSTQGASFPFEIEAQIIEHLWDDPKALAACSLVSSRWLEMARTLSFADVTPGISVALYVDPEPHHSLQAFSDLLCAPESRMGHHIRRLHIHGPDSSTDSIILYDMYDVLTNFLQFHLSRSLLLRVRELRITTLTWKVIPQDLFMKLRSLSELVSLTWEQCRVGCLDELILFSLETFPNLETLGLSWIEFVDDPPAYEDAKEFQIPSRIPSLRSLDIRMVKSMEPFFMHHLFAALSFTTSPLFTSTWSNPLY
ncbi:hypothetical protein H0H92_015429 [Tricholoma furcatifolium]|nr:hypothetical protein H0H92_015429 [Tricholoma furcatifolium]